MFDFVSVRLRTWLSALCLVCVAFWAESAEAKPWKGAELITHQTFKYGAFEARVRAARGGGVITPFFLWKDGSERPGALWQEQDFEIFGRDGTYQTQCMTPGTNGTNRTEHVINHTLPIPAYDHYYTLRMEWTPEALSFYVDGQLVRSETDQQEYAKLLDPAQAEAAQLRIGIWAGDIPWSGSFDATAMPAAAYVNWIATYAYTKGAGPSGSDFTPLWRDDFDADSGRFWRANWTFEYAVNDYVPQNAAFRNGYLVLVLTDEASTGQFPVPPVDDGSIATNPLPEVVPVPGRVEAEEYVDYFDTTPGNSGDAACSSTAVDAQWTGDGTSCNVGWTAPGEWLEYEVATDTTGVFDVNLRVAALDPGKHFHIEVADLFVSEPLDVPALGWQSYSDVTLAGVPLEAGTHVVRVVFDSGDTNLDYLDFVDDGTSELPTCTPHTSSYDAEAMSPTTGGAAPGGWNLWSNGNVSTQHVFQGGHSMVRVRAYGEPAASVWPHMIVRAGGQTIGDVSVDATAYRAYEFYYDAGAGSQPVSISFDNDYYQGGEDRNLLLDTVEIEECL
jgi:endo-1,3-1,4-beta-glycanase ExoK